MIYTKVFFMAASLALLAACSNDAQPAEKTPQAAEQQGTVEETAAKTEEAAKAEKAKAEAEAAEEKAAEEAKAAAEKKAEPKYKLNSANWGVEPIGDAKAEAVLITIDDAPDKQSLKMAKTLKELNVPAIFFVNGHFLDTDEEKETLKAIFDMGFAIGNHTQTHTNLQTISEEQQRDEILAVSKTIEETIGEKPRFFRAPNGSNTDFSKKLVEQEGMLLMNWTYGYDWEKQYMETGALADIMVNTEFLRNGANLLMHDRQWTADALPEIVEGLSKKGYSFVDPAEIEGIK